MVSTTSICYTTATALTATCMRKRRSPIDTQPLLMHEEYEDIVVIEPSKVEEEEKEYNRVVRAAVVSDIRKSSVDLMTLDLGPERISFPW